MHGPRLFGSENAVLIKIHDNYPLLFDVNRDPFETEPRRTAEMPNHPEHRATMEMIMTAYAMEMYTFTFGKMVPYPGGRGGAGSMEFAATAPRIATVTRRIPIRDVSSTLEPATQRQIPRDTWRRGTFTSPDTSSENASKCTSRLIT